MSKRRLSGLNPFARINRDLRGSDSERLSELRAVEELERSGRLSTEHEFMYRDLTILDQKASALLTFNSIMLAAGAVFYTQTDDDLASLVFLAGFLLLGISAFQCLRVVWLQWATTESLTAGKGRLWLDLYRVRDRRTRQYRGAWLLAALALGLLLLGAVLDALGF